MSSLSSREEALDLIALLDSSAHGWNNGGRFNFNVLMADGTTGGEFNFGALLAGSTT